MDAPETSIRKGARSARERSNRASAWELVVDIGGLPVRMWGSDRARYDVLDAVFGSLPRCHEPPRAELQVTPGHIAAPDREPDARYPDLDLWFEGTALHVDSPVLGLTASATPYLARIASADPPPEPVLRRVLHPIATHMLAHMDVFVVHAAAVQRDGRGVLVLGGSGQGKSTLALAAFEDGWTVLSDDLVGLHLESRDVELRSVPKPMAFPGDLAAVSLTDARTPSWDARQRRHLPAAHLDLAIVPLELVVVVGHGDGAHTTFAPIESDVVVAELMQSYASIGHVGLLRRFFPVAAAAARRPAYAIRHGGDVDVRLVEGARILDGLILEIPTR